MRRYSLRQYRQPAMALPRRFLAIHFCTDDTFKVAQNNYPSLCTLLLIVILRDELVFSCHVINIFILKSSYACGISVYILRDNLLLYLVLFKESLMYVGYRYTNLWLLIFHATIAPSARRKWSLRIYHILPIRGAGSLWSAYCMLSHL